MVLRGIAGIAKADALLWDRIDRIDRIDAADPVVNRVNGVNSVMSSVRDRSRRGGVQRPFVLEAAKRKTPDAKRRNPCSFVPAIP
jgi:hypothetical protein